MGYFVYPINDYVDIVENHPVPEDITGPYCSWGIIT
jgi:hypothetical protein